MLADPRASLVGEPDLPSCDYGKSQWIRLADVVLVGPLMIWGGVALHQRQQSGAGIVLGLFGLGTIALNGYNFARFGGFQAAGRETMR